MVVVGWMYGWMPYLLCNRIVFDLAIGVHLNCEGIAGTGALLAHVERVLGHGDLGKCTTIAEVLGPPRPPSRPLAIRGRAGFPQNHGRLVYLPATDDPDTALLGVGR